MSDKRSPFKHLDYYTEKDDREFFGREREELQLAEMLKSNRLVLLYGQSGAGKTSLVQCGLNKQFHPSDWYPLQIRRKDDINRSLTERLREAVGIPDAEQVEEMIEVVYLYNSRPVFLIFDQLEELLIAGSPEEQADFLGTLIRILKGNLPCRVLLIMREEYIAWLSDFEKKIPTLFDWRLRVEPMTEGNLSKVILESCKRFDIGLENAAGDAGQIIENLKTRGKPISLPYLQVYLDKLWREVYAATFSGGAEDPYPPLVFTAQAIEKLGKIENVLETFLEEQKKVIRGNIQKSFPDTNPDLINQVLDDFVTDAGTKQVLPFEQKGGATEILHSEAKNLNGLSPGLRDFCLRQLENSRIIRNGGDHYELAHDALAAIIAEPRIEQRQNLRRLNSSYENYLEYGVFLNAKQLDTFRGLDEGLEPKLRQFIRDSEAHAGAQQAQEEEARERELRLVQEKLKAEGKARKRQWGLLIVLALAFLTSAGLATWALISEQEAKESFENFKEEQTKRVEEETKRIMEKLKIITTDAGNMWELSKGENKYMEYSIIRLKTAIPICELYPDNEEIQQECKKIKSRIQSWENQKNNNADPDKR